MRAEFHNGVKTIASPATDLLRNGRESVRNGIYREPCSLHLTENTDDRLDKAELWAGTASRLGRRGLEFCISVYREKLQ